MVKNLAELRFNRIDEYIFAPFNTFIYLDDDQIVSQYDKVEDLVIEAMNFCFYGIMPRQKI